MCLTNSLTPQAYLNTLQTTPMINEMLFKLLLAEQQKKKEVKFPPQHSFSIPNNEENKQLCNNNTTSFIKPNTIPPLVPHQKLFAPSLNSSFSPASMGQGKSGIFLKESDILKVAKSLEAYPSYLGKMKIPAEEALKEKGLFYKTLYPDYSKSFQENSKFKDKKSERLIKIQKYKNKKRVWEKKISYDCRKKVADSRMRIKGRFISKKVKYYTNCQFLIYSIRKPIKLLQFIPLILQRI